MSTIRLPSRTYARQLDRIREDLDRWYASYRQAAASTTNDWLRTRYEARCEELRAICLHLLEAETALYDLPRLH